MIPNKTTAADFYEGLTSAREPYLRRARSCSELTLPYLIPPEGSNAHRDLDTPYQSVGARGVTNLSAKLLLALLPPNTPFFKLAIDPFELKKIEQDKSLKSQLDTALSEIEQAVQVEIETCAARTTVFEAIQHLVVGGNGLLEVPPEGNLKFYPIDRYVVQRDPMGHVLTVVTKEKTVPLYTVCERKAAGEKWKVWQEVKGKVIPDTDGDYPADKCPYIPLRFTKVDGEDYGRGYVEQYLGDITSHENLSMALVQGGLAASKVLFLVNPNGLTNAKKLSEADNGDFVPGREEDVKCLQLEKYNDIQTAFNQAVAIEKRLETAFLLMSSIQRNAERVTAEEIRNLVTELEASLGGVYSVLAQDLQLPLASALMQRMAEDSRLPKLPKKVVRPTVTTGIAALGRGNDLQKLDAFLAGVAQTFGPEVLMRYVQPGEYFARRAAALGISIKGLVRTDQEVAEADAAAQQQQSAQALTEKLGPAVIREVGTNLQQPTS